MSNKDTYILVSKFAEKAGVSRQAIYSQLDRKLKKYVKEVDGIKYIDKYALIEVYGISEHDDVDNCTCQADNQNVDNTDKHSDTSINALKDVIETLTAQLKEKDKQIDSLLKLQDQQQQLTLVQTKQLEEFEPEKKHFFQKWFNKK